MKYQFELPYTECQKDIVKGKKRCKEHNEMKCKVCGKQAIRKCNVTLRPFVCGIALCKKCECITCKAWSKGFI